jgi:hypothetical protein
LFDDTYIKKDIFFKYTRAYKRAVRKLVVEIGKHNLEFMFKGQPNKQQFYLMLAKLSMVGSSLFPGLEEKIGGLLFDGRSSIENIRDKRRGIAKSYTNPN